MATHYMTTKVVDEEEFSEIDFDLYFEIFGIGSDFPDDWDPAEIKIGSHGVDGFPIQIDRMINQLLTWKELGANYVALEYHPDHIGYPMVGLHISRSTKEEISTFEDKELKKRQKEEKLLELYAEIHKIKNS